jgi:hypothetical protein
VLEVSHIFLFLFIDLLHSSSLLVEENDALNVQYPVKYQHTKIDANSLPSQSLSDVLLILHLSLNVNMHFLCWVHLPSLGIEGKVGLLLGDRSEGNKLFFHFSVHSCWAWFPWLKKKNCWVDY